MRTPAIAALLLAAAVSGCTAETPPAPATPATPAAGAKASPPPAGAPAAAAKTYVFEVEGMT